MSDLAKLRRLSWTSPRREGEEATAIHEAGHAVVACALGLRVSQVNIIADKDGDNVGLCQLAGLPTLKLMLEGTAELSDRRRRQGEHDLSRTSIVSLSGPVATFRDRGSEDWDLAGLVADREAAVNAALWLAGDGESATKQFAEWLVQASDLVAFRWTTIQRVAQELCRERVLAGRQVLSFMNAPEG